MDVSEMRCGQEFSERDVQGEPCCLGRHYQSAFPKNLFTSTDVSEGSNS